jgi:mono/diheme cytochrome c family protein
MRRFAIGAIAAAALLLLGLAGLVAWLNFRDEDDILASAAAFSPTHAQIERGAYLARAGNCVACHTARGGAPYAGGRPIPTPFGTVYSSNITPDAKTGIGTWSAAHFWRAMHNGRSKDGRLLYPAFPYTEYTFVSREDSDAIFAFLWSLPAVAQPDRAHELRFPYDSQIALALWRAMFFRPGTFEPDPTQTPEWNRGAYMARGLGHCIACHSARNVFGATTDLELSGGLIPAMGWYAPSLIAKEEAGVAEWETKDVVALLRHGRSARGSTMGPMAEVVYRSTQYLSDADLAAIAAYLKALPPSARTPGEAPWWSWFGAKGSEPPALAEDVRTRGATLYERECAGCHGDYGEGAAGAYPALAGNRAVTMAVPANVIRVVLSGGYLPATAGNPRPYGMPPYSHVLSDSDIAAVVSYIRTAWGNGGEPVTTFQVQQYRAR